MAALGKLAIYGLAALIAIVLAAKAHDQIFAIQMVIFAIAALIGLVVTAKRTDFDAPPP